MKHPTLTRVENLMQLVHELKDVKEPKEDPNMQSVSVKKGEDDTSLESNHAVGGARARRSGP